jgi:general secretion pathway protein M
MTPAIVAKLSPSQQRIVGIALLVLAVITGLAVLLGPILLLHGHYDRAIAETTDRLERYRRVAAQAPELRQALEAMKERDARRFFLKNTAPNLASAELQELVKAAVESNGGRITTSQNTSAREDGRFRQISVNVQFFATTPSLQKILNALESQMPYCVVDNVTVRPLNAFRGFKPGPGQEPELNVQLDVSGWAYGEATRPPPAAPAKAAAKA